MAFGQPDEAALVDAIRARGERSISLVAVDDERLVGHILFTPVTIQGPDRVREAVGLGPLAVDPDYQRGGLGRGQGSVLSPSVGLPYSDVGECQ